MKSSRAFNRGYVLLVTLGLLVLSTTLLVAVARTAVRHVADAKLAEQQLQRKWAIESAKRAVLPFSEQVLSTVELVERRPVPSVTADVRLGEWTVSLTVADEQAKANVNTLLEKDKAADAEDRLRRTLSGTLAIAHVRLRLGPDDLTRGPPGPDGEPRLTVLSGWGQVFDDVSEEVVRPPGGRSPLDLLTLWGNGGLNIMRAGPETMRAALTPSLTALQIQRLIKARDEALSLRRDARAPAGIAALPGGADAVTRLLAGSGIDPGVRAKVALVAGSNCHSLTIQIRDGRRVWYNTSVLDESRPQRPRTFNFDY